MKCKHQSCFHILLKWRALLGVAKYTKFSVNKAMQVLDVMVKSRSGKQKNRNSVFLLKFTAGDARAQISSSDSSVAAKNVTAGLEDSGVEVGQESEQENTPGGAVKTAADVRDSVSELPSENQKKVNESIEPASRTTTEHIVFGGKSIDQAETEAKKNKPAR